jgi:hypothetical protein
MLQRAARATTRELVQDEELKPLLPAFVRSYRDLSAFWGWIQYEEATYAGRRKLIGEAFTPIMDHLEGRGPAPADAAMSDALATFDPDGVHAVWTKALVRRASDPEGGYHGSSNAAGDCLQAHP